MPLKLVRRGAIWHLRGTVRGRRVAETSGTADRELAEAFRAAREAELFKASLFGERAVVSFARAALSYVEHEPRSPATLALVRRLEAHFGAAPLARIGQEAADRAVERIVGPAAAPATRRRSVYGPLTAILNHAAKRGWCDVPRFDLPRAPRGRTRWLTPAEALALEAAAAPHLRPLLRFLVCTGARMSEALGLDWADVDLMAPHAVFRQPKNGRDRRAMLPPAAVSVLGALPGRTGRVFRRDDGQPYQPKPQGGGGQIKTAWATACRRAGVAASPHDLRHSWASWFYCLSRDPLLLRDEGGWSSLAMVERYAHLAPADLAPAAAAAWGGAHPRIATPFRQPSAAARQAPGA